jgi:hypothetical protein
MQYWFIQENLRILDTAGIHGVSVRGSAGIFCLGVLTYIKHCNVASQLTHYEHTVCSIASLACPYNHSNGHATCPMYNTTPWRRTVPCCLYRTVLTQ